MATNTDDRSLGDMFATLSRETRTLFQQEVQLARAELKEKAFKMGKGVGLIVGGGLIAYGGVLGMIAALVLGLIELGLPPWAGALVGGIAVCGLGYLLIRLGIPALRPEELRPRQTIKTLKEDAQWLRTQTK